MIKVKTHYTPEEVGYNGYRLEVLDDFLQNQINENVIHSANYCLSRDGKVFADNAIGKFSFDPDDERELQPNTIHRIASITKLITAAAIFKLFEDGKLNISQPVSTYIKEFSKAPLNRINLTHLLTHTSGFAVDGGALPHIEIISPYSAIEETFAKGDEDWLKAATSNVELYFETGTQWGYSSFGYTILGEIIHRISGITAEEYITENILKPCGMKDSFFKPSIEQIDRIKINSEHDKKYLERLKNSKNNEINNIWDSVPSTGGGLYSTAYDLVKFGTMLLKNGTYNGKHILGRKTVEKMTAIYTKENILDYCWEQNGVYRRYGLGPDMRHNDDCLYSLGTFFHEGAGKCSLIIDPVEKMVVSYFVPYVDESVWNHVPIWNTQIVIWSGLI